MTSSLVIFVALLIGFSASLEFHERCEDRIVHPIENFNVSQYAGAWYLIQRYNNSLEKEGCNVTIDFNLNGVNATDLNLTLSTAKGNNLTGLAQLQDPTNNQAIFNVTFNSANTSEEYVFVVISTNYTSYSVAWLCKDLTNETSSQIVWVFSRNSILENVRDSAEVNRTLTSNNLNHTLLSRDEETCSSASVTYFLLLPTLVIVLFVSLNV